MNTPRHPTRRQWITLAALLAAATQLTVSAQVLPAPTSPARVKELVALLQSKKLEAYAVKDTAEAGRFVAVYLVPNVQLMLISAGYERPTDVEYRIYQKDFTNAYAELNSSVLAKDKVFFQDALCDGLFPKSTNGAEDIVTIGTAKRVFNGDYNDPKKKPDPKKPSLEDYVKAFSDADAKYTSLVTMLLDELKKT
ncbi:MAG TPA: hypothetical protein VJN96_26560 [Vicinamibacterales bacterium]|nr:hypothetical protein [Vicinamibacterales bacterium]